MLNRRVVAALLGLIVAAASGCSKQDDTKKTTEPAPAAAAKKKEPPAPTKPPFDEFDNAPLKDKLQGDWLVDLADKGRQAWEINGTDITVAEGKKQVTGSIAITSPCTMEVTLDRGGSKEVNRYNVVFDGDALHVGVGNVARKKGDLVLGCFSEVWYSSKGPDCTRWDYADKKWSAKPALCKLDTAGGQTAFRVKKEGGESIGVWGSGDDLMDGELRTHPSKKGASLAAVVKAIAKIEKAEAKALKKKLKARGIR